MQSERWTENPEDEGSTPSWPTNILIFNTVLKLCGGVGIGRRLGLKIR